jgi:hypothetical protein
MPSRLAQEQILSYFPRWRSRFLWPLCNVLDSCFYISRLLCVSVYLLLAGCTRRMLPTFQNFFLNSNRKSVHPRSACPFSEGFVLSLPAVTQTRNQQTWAFCRIVTAERNRSLDGAHSGERATHCDTPAFVPLDGEMCEYRQLDAKNPASTARLFLL